MKKIVVILSMILVLASCNVDNKKVEKTIDDRNFDVDYNFSEYLISPDYSYEKEVDGYVSETFAIDNVTTKEFVKDSIKIFYEDSKYIAFLELENYINILSKMYYEDTKFFTDRENKAWQIRCNYSEEEDEYDSLTLDFNNNIVKLSSIQIIDSCFTTDESGEKIMEAYDNLYYYDGYEMLEESKEVVIDLQKYNLEMVESNGSYIMPMQILTFLFSSYENKLMYDGEKVTYGNIWYMDDYPVAANADDVEYTQDLVDYSTDIMKLIFENYYGLKDLRGNYMNDIESLRDRKNHVYNFKNYFVGLDDSHTSILEFMYGYDTDGYTEKELENYYEASDGYQRVGCGSGSETLRNYNLNDNTTVIEINSFMDDDFADRYLTMIDSVRNYENIVLDIKCNLGGYAHNALIFMYPFLDDQLLTYSGDITGAVEVEVHKKQEELVIEPIQDKNIYLVTSEVTFSAGNYAAILFSNNNVGKIIGENSGGGSAAVSTFTIPNGSINLMSSGDMLLLDSDHNLVENGANVDLEFVVNADTFESDVLSAIQK